LVKFIGRLDLTSGLLIKISKRSPNYSQRNEPESSRSKVSTLRKWKR
jgi:hypothetical protein